MNGLLSQLITKLRAAQQQPQSALPGQPGAQPQPAAVIINTGNQRSLPGGTKIFGLVLAGIALLIAVNSVKQAAPKRPTAPPVTVAANPDAAKRFGEAVRTESAMVRQEMPPEWPVPQQSAAHQPMPPAYYPYSAAPTAQTGPTPAQIERERMRKTAFASPVLALPDMPSPSQSEINSSQNETKAAKSETQAADPETKVPVAEKPDVVPELSASADCRDIERGGKTLYAACEGDWILASTQNKLVGDFAGPVNALVEQDVYSRDRQHLLIPKGTTVLGAAAPVSQAYQARLEVRFHRMLLPDGRGIRLDDIPGLSRSGEMALKDKVDRHLLSTYGSAGLLGLFAGFSQFGFGGTGSYYTGDSGDRYRQNVAASLSQSAQQQMSRNSYRPYGIEIRNGYPIVLRLNRDIHLPEYLPAVKTEFKEKP